MSPSLPLDLPVGSKITIRQFMDDDEEIVPAVTIGPVQEWEDQVGNVLICVPVEDQVDHKRWDCRPESIVSIP